MTSSRFDPGSTSVRPQKPWTSPFYGSMNGPGLKTLVIRWVRLKSDINYSFWHSKIYCKLLKNGRVIIFSYKWSICSPSRFKDIFKIYKLKDIGKLLAWERPLTICQGWEIRCSDFSLLLDLADQQKKTIGYCPKQLSTS